MILDEYISILTTILIGIILTSVIYGGSYILAFQTMGDTEKVSPYECGFNPFEDARHKFQVKFYLVGILFLIFDLEVIFLFPWSISFNYMSIQNLIKTNIFSITNSNQQSFLTLDNFLYYEQINYLIVFIFLFILTIGFIYEWKKGALNW